MQLSGTPAFCDTFDTAAGIGNRSGQLNGTIWGVSRWTGDMNFGSSYQSPWVPSTLTGCNGPQPAKPDGTDVVALNVACIDGIELSKLTMTPIDGRNRSNCGL